MYANYGLSSSQDQGIKVLRCSPREGGGTAGHPPPSPVSRKTKFCLKFQIFCACDAYQHRKQANIFAKIHQFSSKKRLILTKNPKIFAHAKARGYIIACLIKIAHLKWSKKFYVSYPPPESKLCLKIQSLPSPRQKILGTPLTMLTVGHLVHWSQVSHS